MRFIKKIARIPWWGWLFGFGWFVLQYSVYRFGDWLSGVIGTKAMAWLPKIAAIDDLIPVIPVFIVIYIFSYVFWICAPMAVSLTSRRNFINYIIGLSLGYLVGFLIFTFLPTYMDRAAEGLMNYSADGGIFDSMLASIYAADGSEKAFNLFPSYHCLISAYCYLGVRKQPEISRGFKIYTLVMAVLICLSTVFTKQHYVLDVIGGISIALLCYVIVEKLDPGRKLTAQKPAAGQ